MASTVEMLKLRREKSHLLVALVCIELPEESSAVIRELLQEFMDFIYEKPFIQALGVVINPKGEPIRRVNFTNDQIPNVDLFAVASQPVLLVRDSSQMASISTFHGEHFQPTENQVYCRLRFHDPSSP